MLSNEALLAKHSQFVPIFQKLNESHVLIVKTWNSATSMERIQLAAKWLEHPSERKKNERAKSRPYELRRVGSDRLGFNIGFM